MDLSEALRENAAIREFTDDPVPDEMLYRILETARFAPSGGNRQGWRVIAVRDAALKRSMRQLYMPGWLEYIAMVAASLVAWSPLAAPDRDHHRYTFAGGASVYPFVWSILLAARGEGLGGVLTTMHIRREAQVKELLNVPDELALAAVVFLGHPRRRPSRLRRSPVPGFATFDTYDGAPVSQRLR
jgi:nitroreductase